MRLRLPVVLFVATAASTVPLHAQERWDVRVEEVRHITAAMRELVEDMPGPEGSDQARLEWERFGRAMALEAARSWGVMARFGYEPPPMEGLDWTRSRGVEERFVRLHPSWTRGELRTLTSQSFDDLVTYMDGLDGPELRRRDRRTGRTQREELGGLAVTFAAKLQLLRDWVSRAGGRVSG